LKYYAKNDRRIRIFSNESNRKLGGTLKEGFKKATKELVLYSDFDMPFDLNVIVKAIEIFEQNNADILSAFRTNRNIDGLKRTIYSILYNWLINSLFKTDIKDVNFSFKLFKRGPS
jgi:cellulose synthase/poly-beta-1,6-N-acetylglucosamine synthase-like glycosyltransferase